MNGNFSAALQQALRRLAGNIHGQRNASRWRRYIAAHLSRAPRVMMAAGVSADTGLFGKTQ